MFRAGLKLFRRVIFATSLLILLICGAEVGVRLFEAVSGGNICRSTDGQCQDPSQLTVPSWSYYQELKPLATTAVPCRDSKTDVSVHTNSLGFRGAEPMIPKPHDVYRIVVLGDETIFAPETADADHFCTQLQNLLQQQSARPIEVLNAGIPGHCPLTEFVLFKQRLLCLKPDLVLLHYDWSDVADDRLIRRYARCDDAGVPQSCPHAKLYGTKNVRPHEVWRQQFRLLDWGLNIASSEWKLQVARQKASSRDADINPYAWLRDDHPEQNAAFSRSVVPIVEIANLCSTSGCQFALMTSPKPWQVSVKCSRGAGVRLAAGVARDACYLNRAPFDRLARSADRAQIPFVDGTPAIAMGKDAEANFLRYAPRWSPAGHRRMAEYVAGFLFERVPGSWNRPSPSQQDLFNSPLTQPAPRNNPIQWTGGHKADSDRSMPEPAFKHPQQQ